jgi:hypothetical protein
MNTNYVRKDGFSNPDTERFFQQHWGEEQMWAVCNALKHCGICDYGFEVVDSPQQGLWFLCWNQDSAYHQETVHFAFTCQHHFRGDGLSVGPCPWDEQEPL